MWLRPPKGIRLTLFTALAGLATFTAALAAGPGSNLYTFGKGTAETAAFKKAPPWKVHFAQYWTGIPILAQWRTIMRQVVLSDYPEIQLSLSDGQNNPLKLVSDLEDAIARKVDLIIINTGDSQVPVPAVERAIARGIPVVAMQKRINTEQVTVTVVGDDVEQGRDQGEALVNELKRRHGGKAQGKVILVNGTPGASITIEQNQGLKAVLAQHPEVKVVCDQPGNFQREKSVAVLENCLQANPHAEAIWYLGANVGAALATAIEQAGKANRIFIVGGGGSMEALGLIKSGRVIVYDQIFPNAVRPALAVARRVLSGQPVPRLVVVKGGRINAGNVDTYLDRSIPHVDWPKDVPTAWQ